MLGYHYPVNFVRRLFRLPVNGVFAHYVIMLPPLCSHPVSFPIGIIYSHHFLRNPKIFTTTQFLSRTSRFSLTIFEKFSIFFHLPSFFPQYPVFFLLSLKKSEFFCSTKFLSRASCFCLTAFEENRDFFRGYPPSGVSAVAIIVHMQKIRNRSNFFQKIFTSGIFPKILKAFRFYQVYFQKF